MPALKRPHVNVEYVSNYSDELSYKNNQDWLIVLIEHIVDEKR